MATLSQKKLADLAFGGRYSRQNSRSVLKSGKDSVRWRHAGVVNGKSWIGVGVPADSIGCTSARLNNPSRADMHGE